jgi:bla regulator protein BlaR1
MRLIWAGLVLAGCGLVGSARAQQFEVASIKPAAPDARGMFIKNDPGGRITLTNMTLKEMIVIAWKVQPYQVSGGPPWVQSARYDVSTKAESTPNADQMQQMLQALFEERFQLVIRQETKEMPIYALVLARKDGKLGPQMTETTCVTYDRDHPPPPPEPGKPRAMGCGGRQMGPANLRGSGVQVADLPQMLSRMLGRTVIDRTGLTAKYDMNAEWTPDEGLLAQMQMMAPPGSERPTFPEGGPSIYTAFQEQLGLKLESQKGPVEVLVIEKAEKPTEN